VRQHQGAVNSIQRILSVSVRGVDHRQAKRRHAMVRRPLFEACTMADSEYSRKHDLECLRLASDLTQLANGTVSPVLRSQFLRMAKVWTRLAELDQTQTARQGIE
jgi:hypothetical protein